MKDVIIGDVGLGCSAIKIFSINEDECNVNVSQNNKAYWISGGLLNISCKISKDSKEGLIIKDLVENFKHRELEAYLNNLMIKNCDVETLYNIIKNIETFSYKEGYRQCQIDIRKSLGL